MYCAVADEPSPACANIAATSGLAALVPPSTDQPDPDGPLLNTATPVCGSAIADTSENARIAHVVLAGWYGGLAKLPLHELPPPPQATSAKPRGVLAVISEVPPTAMTLLDDAGKFAACSKPWSPVDAKIAMPGWVTKHVRVAGVRPADRLEVDLRATPAVADDGRAHHRRGVVRRPAGRRSCRRCASTTMILQSGHAELTMSTSSAVSSVQSSSAGGRPGNGDGCPLVLTIVRQPSEPPHTGSPNVLRYVARSDSRVGVAVGVDDRDGRVRVGGVDDLVRVHQVGRTEALRRVEVLDATRRVDPRVREAADRAVADRALRSGRGWLAVTHELRRSGERDAARQAKNPKNHDKCSHARRGHEPS